MNRLIAKRSAFLLIAMLLLKAVPLQAAQSGDDILGVWNTTDNKSQVQIFKEKNKYCAKIISLKEPNWPADDKEGMGGKSKNDRGNPDLKLRNRPIVGMQFMNGFVSDGKNQWVGGKIYDPEVGKTYKCKLTLVDTNHLEVRGYIGISLIGRTVVWTR
ncbi:MAG: hypothetical protein JWQ71_3604 [Pedosphaera sp.]|nr:hypothetical protein [Pedosphaera sp.]